MSPDERYAGPHSCAARTPRTLSDIDAALVGVARAAADRFDAITAHGVLGEDDVRRLTCFAGQLRASVQVHQGVTEGFARAATTIIWRLALQGIPVEVGVLTASPGSRPMPDAVVTLLVQAASRHPVPGKRIRCVGSPEWELLSLTLSRKGATSVGLRPGSPRTFDDVTVEISDVEADAIGLVVATVERHLLDDTHDSAHLSSKV